MNVNKLLFRGLDGSRLSNTKKLLFQDDAETLWELDNVARELESLADFGTPLYSFRDAIGEFLGFTEGFLLSIEGAVESSSVKTNVRWLFELDVPTDLTSTLFGLAQKVTWPINSRVHAACVREILFLSLLSTYLNSEVYDDFSDGRNSLRSVGLFPIEVNGRNIFDQKLLDPYDAYDLGDQVSASSEITSSHEAATISRYIDVFLRDDGSPIDADADKSLWKEIRCNCVSATDARKLVKLSGEPSKQRAALLSQKISGEDTFVFDSYELGNQREPEIANLVQKLFPSEKLIHNRNLAYGSNMRHVATPDMVGPESLCEIKVSTKPLRQSKTTYRDQLQWQMHVTGFEKVLFVVENRFSEELEHEWIFRDQSRIDTLVKSANEFLAELDIRRSDISLQELPEDSASQEFDLEAHVYDVSDIKSYIDSVEDLDHAIEYGDLPVVRFLSKQETKEALKLYSQGHSIYQIASKMAVASNDVVGTLGLHFYDLNEELVNPLAEKFRYGWSFEELTYLSEMLTSGHSIDEICSALGRDRLGVLYKIFTGHCPEIPSKLAKAFKIKL